MYNVIMDVIEMIIWRQNELASTFPRVSCLELAIEHMTGKLVNDS